jgi:Tn3 transposase DDE domain
VSEFALQLKERANDDDWAESTGVDLAGSTARCEARSQPLVTAGWEPSGARLRIMTIHVLIVYAGILAHGTALSAAATARMIPQLSPASVRQAMKWASDERRLTEACGAIRTFMHRHSISATWDARIWPPPT